MLVDRPVDSLEGETRLSREIFGAMDGPGITDAFRPPTEGITALRAEGLRNAALCWEDLEDRIDGSYCTARKYR